MGNLIQGFFGGGSAGSTSNIKPISDSQSNSHKRIRNVDISKMSRESLSKKISKGGTIKKEVDKFFFKDTVLEDGTVMKKGSRIVQKSVVETPQAFMQKMKKKWAGKEFGVGERSFKEKHGYEYKDEQGNIIREHYKEDDRKKYLKIVKEELVAAGFTKEEIAKENKRLRVVRNLNISSINQARDEAEQAMSQKLQDKRKKQSKEQREKERIDKAKVSAGNIKTSSVDIGVERQEGLASVKQEGPSPDRSFGQQEAASITAAIGAKQVEAAEKKNESNVVDMFERVSEMGRKDQPEERSDSFFKDESTDDQESKKAA